jgi:hypothetical protein
MHTPHEGQDGIKEFFEKKKKRNVMFDNYTYQYIQQNKYLNLYVDLVKEEQKDPNLIENSAKRCCAN